jgi:hypothetical protein
MKTKQPVLRYREETVLWRSEFIGASYASILSGQCNYESFLQSKFTRKFKPQTQEGFTPSKSSETLGREIMAQGHQYHEEYRQFIENIGPLTGREFSYYLSGEYNNFALKSIVDQVVITDTIELEEWKFTKNGIIDPISEAQVLINCYLLEELNLPTTYTIKAWKKDSIDLDSGKFPRQAMTISKPYDSTQKLKAREFLDKLTKLFSGETEVKVNVNGGCRYCDFGPGKINSGRCEYYG